MRAKPPGRRGTPRDATGRHGTPRDATGCHGMPRDATGCHGMPRDATGSAGMPGMPRDAAGCGAVVAGVLCRTLQCWTLQCCSLDAVCCKVVYIAVVKLCMYIAVLLSAHCGTVGCTWGCDAARRGLRVCRGEVGRGAVRWRSARPLAAVRTALWRSVCCGAVHCGTVRYVRHGPLSVAHSRVAGHLRGGPRPLRRRFTD